MSTDKPRNSDLREQVENATQEMAKSEENALAALEEASETQETHTVTLTGDVEVEVIDTVPGNLEREAARVQHKRKHGDVDDAITAMINVMTHLIQTDGYDSKAVWEQYDNQHGSANLMQCAMAVTEPYYEKQKEIEDQRQFRGQ